MYLLSKMVTSPPAILFDWRVNLAEDAGMGGIIELFFRLSVKNSKPCEPRKEKTSYFPLYWLFNRDPPYTMVLFPYLYTPL